MAKSYKEIMNTISTFIFDVDGVLTDGSVFVSNDGEMQRSMSIKDGYALKTAVDAKYNVAIISGGTNEGVRIRLQNLGISDVFLGVSDKVAIFKEYCEINQIAPDNVLYMGDDIPDYHVMQLVGLPCCPQDACPEIKNTASYISHQFGGKGAARDVIEQVMKVQGKWLENFDGKNN